MYLFPYEKIRPNSNIVLHGYGKVGRDYLDQIRKNHYCNIPTIIDSNAYNITDCPIDIINPSDFKEDKEIDCILIAISRENHHIAKSIMEYYVCCGIEREKIICADADEYVENFRPKLVKPVNDNKLHIAFVCKSGLGDVLLDIYLADRLRELTNGQCKIVFCTEYKEILDGISCIDDVRENIKSEEHDLILGSLIIKQIISWNPEKIKNISECLYDFCNSIISYTIQNKGKFDYLHLMCLARLYGRNRVDISNIFGNIGIDRNKSIIFETKPDEKDILRMYGLDKVSYIVMNRDVDKVQGTGHPKLWLLKYYVVLVNLIKTYYPKYKIVQLGARSDDSIIENVDLCLCGRTTLSELKAILRRADFLISGEGGLVHINHFLGNRSVVLYGPTDEKFFGYDKDVACVNRSGVCDIPCNYIREDYVKGCIKGMNPAGCMKALTPEFVFNKIKDSGLLEEK